MYTGGGILTERNIQEIMDNWEVFSGKREIRLRNTRVNYDQTQQMNASMNGRFTQSILRKLPFHEHCPKTGTLLMDDTSNSDIPALSSTGSSAYYICQQFGKFLFEILFDGRQQLKYTPDKDDDDEEKEEASAEEEAVKVVNTPTTAEGNS